MCMTTWISFYISSYGFIVIISFRIFSHHPSIDSRHQFLIFFFAVITGTILSHHIPDFSGFY